jgi:DNA-binding cell septation regulator SpoVG
VTPNASLVEAVTFKAHPGAGAKTGLIGMATLRLAGAVLIEGVAVRRTREGRVYLSFPSREMRTGERRHVVRPVDAAARKRVEEDVIAQLRARGVLP